MQVKVHDLVKIIKQPKMQFARIEGLICVVAEVDPNDHNYCEIHELQLTGELFGGHGAVPTDCLGSVDSALWLSAQ